MSQNRISKKKMASYSMGFFIDALVVATFGVLVFRYYNVELGLTAVYMMIGFIIFSIWNMVNDPLIGYITDRPFRWSKKYGFRAPWIVIGAVAMSFIYFFIFYIPPIFDPKTNPIALLIYMIVITCLYDLFYSMFNSHFVGGFANIFRTKENRRSGGTIALFIGTIGRFVGIALIIGAIIIEKNPSTYLIAAILTSLVILICLLLFFPGFYENEAVKIRYLQIYDFMEKTNYKLPLFEIVKCAFKQKNFMISMISFSLFTFAYSLQQTAMLYFIIDVLGYNEAVLTIAMLAFIIGFLITIFLWMSLAKVIGHSNQYGLGLILLGIYFISFMWITNSIELIVWHFFGGIAYAAFACMFMAIASDCYDEVTNACGRHQESTLMGMRNFLRNFAFVIIALVMGITQIVTAYDPNSVSEVAKLGIRIDIAIIPAIFVWVGALLIFLFYDLKGEKRENLMKSLKEKKL
ncbi:MAG TPA: MFS transporter [Candidatus Lokiarchaeia archaeon]